MQQGQKTDIEMTLMILRQTSMPVLVSSACTALLKAAEPRKSMTCNNKCTLHRHCCTASESNKDAHLARGGWQQLLLLLLTRTALVMPKLSICRNTFSTFCNIDLLHLRSCWP